MNNKNRERRKKIDDILTKHANKLRILKQKRDTIISNFLKTLQEKKLEELRSTLNSEKRI